VKKDVSQPLIIAISVVVVILVGLFGWVAVESRNA